jgi:hypothetical protein
MPVNPGHTWSQVQNFVRTLEIHIHNQFPEDYQSREIAIEAPGKNIP